MIKKILAINACLLTSFSLSAAQYYGPDLCAYPQYQCIKVAGNQSWERLFPDEAQREIVQKLNRTYNYLWAGKVIAVPKHLDQMTIFDIAPFPLKIEDKERQVIVDQDKLAWAAFDNGKLIKWGPIASGRDKCPDSANMCRTMTGIFRFFSKENDKCRSDIFPIGKGGAKMPWCMYYHKGFALHGSDDMPGYRASHGCVRLFTSDAKWLNLEFVDTGNDENGHMGTKVIIRPIYIKTSEKKT